MKKTAVKRSKRKRSRERARVQLAPPSPLDLVVAARVFGRHSRRPPPYSSDMLACMMVVEAMSDAGYGFKCHVAADGRAVVNFRCEKDPCLRHGAAPSGPHGALDVTGSSLPDAVCNAALHLCP